MGLQLELQWGLLQHSWSHLQPDRQAWPRPLPRLFRHLYSPQGP